MARVAGRLDLERGRLPGARGDGAGGDGAGDRVRDELPQFLCDGRYSRMTPTRLGSWTWIVSTKRTCRVWAVMTTECVRTPPPK